MDRSVLHCDLNNFFASVACLDHPEFKGKPVIVGGSTADRHGIVLAKNELAKKLGIYTGEPLTELKIKYPDIAVVSPNFERYSYYSKIAKEIYSLYTDRVEPFGLDECWIDVSSSTSLFGQDKKIANEISSRIKDETGLTLSIGVSFNKVFSKIGSDMKKPDAITVINKEEYKNIVWPMPTRTIIGIGKSTEEQLFKLGIKTLGQLAEADIKSLYTRLGKIGPRLRSYARGEDWSLISEKDVIPPPKSVGRSVTLKYNIENFDEVFGIFLFLAESIATELRFSSLIAKGISIQMKTANLEGKEFQCILSHPSRTAFFMASEGIKLFKEQYKPDLGLRAVGIRAINLLDESAQYQLNIFDDSKKDIEREILETRMDELRGKYGKGIIKRASIINNQFIQTPDNTFRAYFNNFISI